MIEPCYTCGEAKKTEKQRKLESSRENKEQEGIDMAKQAGANGFFIALAKNETGYMVSLTRPEGSSLEWSYVNIM